MQPYVIEAELVDWNVEEEAELAEGFSPQQLHKDAHLPRYAPCVQFLLQQQLSVKQGTSKSNDRLIASQTLLRPGVDIRSRETATVELI